MGIDAHNQRGVVDVVGDAGQGTVPAQDDDQVSPEEIRPLDQFPGP